MSLEFAHGSQLWASADAATTVYTISGLTFSPKALMFVTMGLSNATDAASQAADERVSYGFATSTSDRRCVGSISVDAGGNQQCTSFERDDAVVATTDLAGFTGVLDLNSITSDGFTLIVDDAVPADIRVFWFAWGGDDIENAATGRFLEPLSTGVVSYNVAGWLSSVLGDNVVLFVGASQHAGSPPAVNTLADAYLCVGAATATGAGNQFVAVSNEDDGSATMDTDGYVQDAECCAGIDVGGGNVSTRAQFNGFDSTGFDLNWVEVLNDRVFIYLAIQGGSWKAGSYTLALGTIGNTATVSGLKFRPKGAMHVSTDRVESTVDTSVQEAKQSIGCWSSTSARRSMSYWSENSTGNAEIDLAIEYDGCLCFPTNAGAIDWVVDINAINQDGFQVIVDDARAVALTDFEMFVAFGDSPRPSATFPDYTAREQKVEVSGMRPPNQVN